MFTFQTPRFDAAGQADEPGWTRVPSQGGSNQIYIYDSKLDLRSMIADGGKGLELFTVACQEAGPHLMSSTDTQLKPWYMTINLLSSVAIPTRRWKDIVDDIYGSETNMPGFLSDGVTNDPDDEINRQYNTSQIIYGEWQWYATNSNVPYGAGVAVRGSTQCLQSGVFGSGELVVGPTLYHYRIIINPNVSIRIEAPATNVQCRGEVVDLSEGREVAQMMRLGQR